MKMVKTYLVLVNAAVVKTSKKGKQILIIKRSKREEHQAGKWCLPGGKLEETKFCVQALEKTVKREILEETGIKIVPWAIIYNNTFKHTEDKQLTLAIVFLCDYFSGIAKPLEDTEEVKWISEEETWFNLSFPQM